MALTLPYSFGSATALDKLFATQLQVDLDLIASRVGALGQLPGTATNDAATAGNVGEYIESVVPIGSAVALTSTVAANVTSISLTAGDWDVRLAGYLVVAGTTAITLGLGSISLVSATVDSTAGRVIAVTIPAAGFTGGTGYAFPIASYRLSLASTTTVFFVALANFTVSTVSVWGMISARRMR